MTVEPNHTDEPTFESHADILSPWAKIVGSYEQDVAIEVETAGTVYPCRVVVADSIDLKAYLHCFAADQHFVAVGDKDDGSAALIDAERGEYIGAVTDVSIDQ